MTPIPDAAPDRGRKEAEEALPGHPVHFLERTASPPLAEEAAPAAPAAYAVYGGMRFASVGGAKAVPKGRQELGQRLPSRRRLTLPVGVPPALGRRLATSWETYSGVWWIPRDAYTIMVVHLELEPMHRPSGVGCLLRKHVARHPILGEVSTRIGRHERAVTVDLSASTLVVQWHRPEETTQGARTGGALRHNEFDCSAVVELDPAARGNRAAPHADLVGGTLKQYRDSHLRRPRTAAAGQSFEEAIGLLVQKLERSCEWRSTSSFSPQLTPYPTSALSPASTPFVLPSCPIPSPASTAQAR
eukprot:TRINITY_DN9670_c0_g1_i1.p1 TRINITY_DN9670_c0_g1~~TRINITY_DN9670_c0_g1_i1.p1  ORF type:complete len:302 (+),score=59.59 TRINITY_DN9670_c0_g1_i1:848-1753(+)